jgi:hypothetical protein
VRKLMLLLSSGIAYVGLASASVTASLDGGAPALVGSGLYRYTYTAVLQSNVLEAGDYFVLYDFYGYKPGSMTAPNSTWTTDDSETTGPHPGNSVNDSPAVVNLLWVYQGVNVSAAAAPVMLGKFSADSNSGQVGKLPFAGITDGGNFDFLDTAAGPIPEPSTTGLLGAGLAAVLCAKKRRTC